MTTIRRNTKRFRAVLENAKNIKVFTLDNGFVAQDLPEIAGREYMQDVLNRYPDTKLLDNKGMSSRYEYTVHIHSNRWYGFDN